MTIHFKIARSLLEQIRADLYRPHPFAFERVGFLFIRPGITTLLGNPEPSHNHNGRKNNPATKPSPKWYSRFLRWLSPTWTDVLEENGSIAVSGKRREETLMILAVSYFPVCDKDYIKDPTVGAKIGSAAIRDAMQRSLDTSMGVIHVHMHEGTGRPGFSSTDRKSMNTLMPSFFNVSPSMPHGALVFNEDSMAGVIWKAKKTSLAISRVSIIGYPCDFSGGIDHVRTLQ